MQNTIEKNNWKFKPFLWVLIIVALFIFLYAIRSILLPFVIGILTAYFLHPLMKKLQKCKLSTAVSAGLITIGFIVIMLLLCVSVLPLIGGQLQELIQALPEYVVHLQQTYGGDIHAYIAKLSPDQVNSIQENIASVGTTAVGMTGKILGNVMQSGLFVLNLVSLLFLTPIVVFYLLRDWENVVRKGRELLPVQHAQVIKEQLDIIDKTLSGFIRGQTNVCLIMALYYAVTLSLVGLHFSIALGILSGLLLFIPFAGFASCFVAALMVGLFQFGVGGTFFAVIGVYMVGQLLESAALTPNLVGDKVGLHPIWIIFGMLAGGALFGFVGIFISLPVTAVLGVLIRFTLKKYKNSALYLA